MKKPTGTTKHSQTAPYHRIENIRYNQTLTMLFTLTPHPGTRTPQLPPQAIAARRIGKQKRAIAPLHGSAVIQSGQHL